MTRKIACLSVAALALFALAACITESASVRPQGDEGYRPPAKGPRHAPVTIHVYSDFECPFCSQVGPKLDALREEYGDKLRIEFGQYPLPMHPSARLAAAASLAAHDQGKFWEMHDALFANQGNVTRETVAAFAAQLGLDVERLGAAIDKGVFTERIDAEIALAKSMGVKGTPAFVINGVILFGNQPYPDFKAAVDDARTRADAMMKAGVALEDLDREFLKLAVEYKGKPPSGAKPAAADGNKELPSGRRDPAAAHSDAMMKDADVAAAPPIAEQYGLHNVRGAPEGHPAIPDRHPIPLAGSPAQGPDHAPVTLVVFSDFQCPYCATMSQLLRETQDAYREKVRVVFKHFPLDFHEMARPAAEAAMSAQDQGKFWAMHDAIFAVKGGKALTREAIVGAGQKAGLDPARLEADLRAEAHRAQIDRDLALGAELDVNGTPTLFINGKAVGGVPKAEDLKALIDEELKRQK